MLITGLSQSSPLDAHHAAIPPVQLTRNGSPSVPVLHQHVPPAIGGPCLLAALGVQTTIRTTIPTSSKTMRLCKDSGSNLRHGVSGQTSHTRRFIQPPLTHVLVLSCVVVVTGTAWFQTTSRIISSQAVSVLSKRDSQQLLFLTRRLRPW